MATASRGLTTVFDKDLRDSSGHHRVVRYSLGGLQCMCLMRHETDGFIGAIEEPEEQQDGDNSKADDLLGALQSMSIASPRVEATGSVQVLKKGRVVEPSSIIEIKTRSAHRRLQLDEVTPQLWFAQTPTLFMGYHQNGNFQEVSKREMKTEFEEWEKRQQAHLKNLVALLRKLNAMARATKSGRCVVVSEGTKSSARMRIFESKGTRAVLPDNIISLYKWADEEEADSAKADDGKEA